MSDQKYVLVPVEPTPEMLVAINWPNDPAGYRAMLAAAPQPAEQSFDFADAYRGARDDLAIWKRRALEAERINNALKEPQNHAYHTGRQREREQLADNTAACAAANEYCQTVGIGQIGSSAIQALIDDHRRLRGITPALPPFPPEGAGLPRYGLRWNGPEQPLSVPMDDGYWTPWHLAVTSQTRPPLGKKHTGMCISAAGLLRRVRGQLKFGALAMLEHLNEMSIRYYGGDIAAVDEFLQLYCLDEHRPSQPESQEVA